MRTLTRHELAARRETRRRRERRRRSLSLLLVGVPLVAALLAAALLTRSGNGVRIVTAPHPALAAPLPQVGLGTARPPENVVLADAEGVELRLPIPRDLVTAIAFHPVDSASAVRLDPRSVDHEVAPRAGRSGPDTAGLDVGAPVGTAVYSPVSGVVASVVDPYMVHGRGIGYEVAIAPASAAGLLVRITHLDAPPAFDRPRVGDAVTAGVTDIGRVADFSGVVEQEIARYTNDSGNHVHIEMIRAGGGA